MNRAWRISHLVLTMLLAVTVLPAINGRYVAAQERDLAFLDFEGGVDGQVIGSSIPGVTFSNTAGKDWVYGDVRTGNYNAPYPENCPSFGGQCAYAVAGNIFAWMGPVQGNGRIDFTEGTGTVFKADFSTGEALTIQGYNAAGEVVASKSLSSNLRTGRLDTVELRSPAGQSMSYIMIMGAENRWLMDNMYTNAPIDSQPPRPTPEDEGDVDSSSTLVAVSTNPNISVQPGGIFTCTILVRNIGEGDADNVTATMPFDPAKVQVVDATFSQDTAWVSQLNGDNLVFETGRIPEGGGVMTATVRLRVLPGVPAGAGLGARLKIKGNGVEVDREWSNLVPLVVGTTSVNQPFYPLVVAPASAPAGSNFTFASSIFVPNEPVTFWYNTPSGASFEITRVAADGEGTVNETFISASDLPGGTYSMVAYGNWSQLTSTTTFVVQGGSGDEGGGS